MNLAIKLKQIYSIELTSHHDACDCLHSYPLYKNVHDAGAFHTKSINNNNNIRVVFEAYKKKYTETEAERQSLGEDWGKNCINSLTTI